MGRGIFFPNLKTSLLCTPLRTAVKRLKKASGHPAKPDALMPQPGSLTNACAFVGETGLTFRKLKPLTCARLPSLFALFHSGISGQQTFLFQNRPHCGINFQQSPSNPESNRAGLPDWPSAMRLRSDVEIVHRLGHLKRLQDGELQRRSREILLKGTAIDLYHPTPPQESDSSDSGFATAGCSKSVCFGHKSN
jgi:hypothetical protein